MSGILASEDVKLKLCTRKLRDIENILCRVPLTAGDLLQIKDLKNKFPEAKHRPKTMTQSYNCHGLTFASRRAAINSSANVEHVLNEDDYEEISRENVLPGDIIIYRAAPEDGGEIEHSGIVITRPESHGGLIGVPEILSKWGKTDEALHMANYGPYSTYRTSYYRVTK